MTGITIYLEGGGDSPGTKRSLRLGMDQFLSALKDAAREKRMRWKLIACGSRQQAFRHWSRASESVGYPIRVLLVDAEDPVHGTSVAHLARRDGWQVDDADEVRVHLMIQRMETWIVADPDALRSYYGKSFVRAAIPDATDPETVEKRRIATALRRSTERTQKGAYHKTKHAPDLLKMMNPERVRERCPACDRFFRVVSELISLA